MILVNYMVGMPIAADVIHCLIMFVGIIIAIHVRKIGLAGDNTTEREIAYLKMVKAIFLLMPLVGIVVGFFFYL